MIDFIIINKYVYVQILCLPFRVFFVFCNTKHIAITRTIIKTKHPVGINVIVSMLCDEDVPDKKNKYIVIINVNVKKKTYATSTVFIQKKKPTIFKSLTDRL